MDAGDFLLIHAGERGGPAGLTLSKVSVNSRVTSYDPDAFCAGRD